MIPQEHHCTLERKLTWQNLLNASLKTSSNKWECFFSGRLKFEYFHYGGREHKSLIDYMLCSARFSLWYLKKVPKVVVHYEKYRTIMTPGGKPGEGNQK